MSRRLGLALSAALMASVVVAAPAQAAVTVTELAKDTDWTSYSAIAINDAGVAVGTAAGEYHPGSPWTRVVRWQPDGTFEYVGEWIPNFNDQARAINSHGVIAGSTRDANGRTWPARFELNGTRTLLDPGGSYTYTTVKGIDDSGAVYAEARDSGRESFDILRWDANGQRTVMALPEGFSHPHLNSAAANGYVAGWATGGSPRRWHALRWSPDGSVTALPLLPGGHSATGNSVNRNGDVVGGAADANGHTHAVRWNSDGSMAVLGLRGYAWDINDEGVAVGIDENVMPMRWNRAGDALALGKTAIDADHLVQSINNAGVVVGYAGSDWSTKTGIKWTVG